MFSINNNNNNNNNNDNNTILLLLLFDLYFDITFIFEFYPDLLHEFVIFEIEEILHGADITNILGAMLCY